MKPVYAKASRLAVQPMLPPMTKEERAERLKCVYGRDRRQSTLCLLAPDHCGLC